MELLELDTIRWAALLISALLVGLTKAGFGAGAGILAVPLMAVALGAADMLPVMLPVLICGDVFSIVHYPKERDWRNLKMLVPSCIAGVGLGWVALAVLKNVGGSKEGLSTVLDPLVGGICLAFLLVQVWRYFRESRLTERPEPYQPKTWHGLGVGTVAGITSTLSHAAGPLVALFMLPQKLDKRIYVGTAVTYFFFGNAVKFIPYAFQGMFTKQTLCTSLVLLPAVVLGTFVGVLLNRKFSGRAFTLFIYACTLAMVVKLLLPVVLGMVAKLFPSVPL